jgi:hypothetical protein
VSEKHFRGVKAARDGYDKTAEEPSPYAEFLRLCVKEIFPEDRDLPGHVIDDISGMRGNRSRKLPPDIQWLALRKLRMLN